MRKTILIITLVVFGIFAWSQAAAFAAISDTVSVTATVGAGTSMVDIIQTSVGFGTVAGLVSDHRFSAGPMAVSYFAANDAWTIRVFTDNSPGNGPEPEKAGLVGADGVTYTPLKVWNPNYGPEGYTTTPPDPENDTYWVGNWYRIPEKDEHDPFDPYTWRRLCYNGAELNPAGFDNYLAIDVQGVKAQGYSTTLTVEIIHQ